MSTKILSSTYISDHPYFKARRDAYQLESGKVVDPYFLVELPPCVVCFGVTTEEKVLMVKQYRHPIGRQSLELPGGFIDAGELPEVAVAREMLEETGFAFGEYIYLGKIAANPGVLNNFTTMYLATGGHKIGEQNLDPNEEIGVLQYSFDEVLDKLQAGEIVQSMHALCTIYALKKLGRY